MNISAGRFGFKAHTQLQCRTIIAPWVDKKRIIACLKNRDYSSSSLPLRYIPKNSRRSTKFDSSDSEAVKIFKRKGISEFPEQSNRSSNKVSNDGNSIRKGFDYNTKTWDRSKAVIDDRVDDSVEESNELSDGNIEDETKNFDKKTISSEVSQDQNVSRKSFKFDPRTRYRYQALTSSNYFKLHDAEQEPFEEFDGDNILEEREDGLSEELVSGHKNCYQQSKSDEDGDLLPSENKTKQEAEKSALKLLARRAYTMFELKKKLCGKKFPPDIVEDLINDFQNRGWLNDERYAEAYCQAKWSSSTWGPRRIKQQLSLKGVKHHDSEEAVRVVFKDGASEDQEKQSLRHGLSKASMDQLLVQASKQWSRGRDLPQEKRKARIARWLQYRGFNWDVIGFVVNKLESNHRP